MTATIPPRHWHMRDEPTAEGWRVTATHKPSGLSATVQGRTNHRLATLAKFEVCTRLAALQVLDMGDPRRALEELATVPTLRGRAEAALRVLRGLNAIGETSSRTGYKVDDATREAVDNRNEEARDEARRLLAEVLL